MYKDNKFDGKKKVAMMLLISVMVSGCSKPAETPDVSETTTTAATTVTISETTVQTTTETEAEAEETEDLLEGQLDYMMKRREDTWTGPSEISDLSLIEDEGLRAAAQSYSDEGYTIYDRLSTRLFGDDTYEFYIGFEAECYEDGMLKHVSVWKMNEELFNSFILEHEVWWNDDEGGSTDDGVTVRRTGFDTEAPYQAYFEFNRETGLMTFYEQDSTADQWDLHSVPEEALDVFSSDEVEALASNCLDAGYTIDRVGEPDVTALEYDITLGFVAERDQRTVWILMMDEDTFEQFFVEDCMEGVEASEYETEDDGTVIRYYNYAYNDAYEYDRDTGIAVWIDDHHLTACTRTGFDNSFDAIHGN